MDYWEDRIGRAGHEKYAAAIEKFRAGRGPSRLDQHVLYDELTNIGITAEEADEMVNLEVENWGETS